MVSPNDEHGLDRTARSVLQRNLETIRQRLARACSRSGRSPGSVFLIPVTKNISVEVARILFELGQKDLGENRPQELQRKHNELPKSVLWHMIGNLQTNKVRRLLPMVAMIHSLDRWSLAEVLSKEAVRISRSIKVTIQANLTSEEAKHGFDAQELRETFPRIIELPGLEVVGLMVMARLESDPERTRSTFAELRNLRDELRESFPDGPQLPVLSMGMSQDFEVAIEEGATHVRIGSALFEEL